MIDGRPTSASFLKCAHKSIAPLLRVSEKRCKGTGYNFNRQIIDCRNFLARNLRQISTIISLNLLGNTSYTHPIAG